MSLQNINEKIPGHLLGHKLVRLEFRHLIFFLPLLSLTLFIGHDKRSDSSRESGSSKSFAVLRKHSWQTGTYSSIFSKYVFICLCRKWSPSAPLMSQSLGLLAFLTTRAYSSHLLASSLLLLLRSLFSAGRCLHTVLDVTRTCRTEPTGWTKLTVLYFGITLTRIHRHSVCSPADSPA